MRLPFVEYFWRIPRFSWRLRLPRNRTAGSQPQGREASRIATVRPADIESLRSVPSGITFLPQLLSDSRSFPAGVQAPNGSRNDERPSVALFCPRLFSCKNSLSSRESRFCCILLLLSNNVPSLL